MLGGSAAVVVISGALEWLASSEKERDLSEWLSEGAGGFWSVLTSNFGGPPRLPWLKGRMRLAFLFLSLNGIVVFIAYKSFLTAEMAVRRVKMPFSSQHTSGTAGVGLQVSHFCLRQADYGTVDVVFLLGLLFIFESIRDTEIFIKIKL